MGLLKKMIFNIFLVVILVGIGSVEIFAETSGENIASGECGDSLIWELNSEGVLEISGSGEMEDFYLFSTRSDVPWYELREQITKVIMEEGVTTIGDNAFSGCGNIQEVELPDTLLKIGDYAFEDCLGLLKIKLPSNVVEIGEEAFYNCTGMTGVYIEDLSKWCQINFTISSNPLRYANHLYINNELVTELIIPSSVDVIKAYAFEGMADVTEIQMPEGIISIGEYAFAEMIGLTEIEIPVTVEEIGEGAFWNCDNLSKVYIETLEDWLEIAFQDEYANPLYTIYGGELYVGGELLTDLVIPNGIENIGAYAFINSTCINSVYIPDTLRNVGESAFNNCSNIVSVYVDNLNTWCNIKFTSSYANPAYYGCLYISNEAVTSVQIPKNLTKIGDYLFENCKDLTTVIIPEGVTTIGMGAFSGCSKLATIEMPESITTIEAGAFRSCHKFNQALPSNITTIGMGAFEGCTEMTTVEIPAGVTRIEERTFYSCFNLVNVSIPRNVEYIGEQAFYYCENLDNITFYGNKPQFDGNKIFYKVTAKAYYPADNTTWQSLSNYGGTIKWNAVETEIIGSGSCGDNLTWELTSDGALIISGTGNMTRYGSDMSTPWYTYRDIITSVELKEGVTSIGGFAFCDYPNLRFVKLPEGLELIGIQAFNGCSKLSTISIPATVKTIESNAFSECNGLVGVYITDLTSWCQISFKNAMSNPVYYGKVLYLNNELLEKLQVSEDVSGIGDYAFYNCSSITDLVLSDAVKTIGYSSFYGCYNLKNINIDDGITNIGSYAFYNCKSIEELEIPKTIVAIDNSAFYNCTKLSYVYVYDIKAWCKIEFETASSNPLYYADLYVDDLLAKSIVIPKEVTDLGQYAFYNCSYLKEIKFQGDAPEFGEKCLYNVEASVLFPAENTTWNNTLMKNYGGDIVWAGYGDIRNAKVQLLEDTYVYDGSEKTPHVEVVIGNTVLRENVDYTVRYENNIDVGLATAIITGNGNYIESTEISFEITKPIIDLVIIGQSESQIIEVGDMAVFEVDAQGDALTFKWQYSKSQGRYWYDSKMEGSETCKLSVEGVLTRNGQMYRCLITDERGNTVTSKEVMLTVVEKTKSFYITTQPINQTVAEGENAVFVVEATGTDLAYQWQYSSNGETWYKSGMEGYNTNQLTVPALKKRNGQMYRCIITDAGGEKLVTDGAVLTVDNHIELNILKQPEDKSARKGDVVTFSVEATGEELTYQWQYSNNSGKYWYDSGMEGSTTNELVVEVTTKRDGQMYRCVVSDANKNKMTSEPATLRMTADEMIIITQPASQTVLEGTTIQFLVEATGEELTYQWQYSNNDGKYWFNSGMDGSNTNVLSVEALSKRNGQMYRCVITDVNGNTITSDTAKLSLKEDGIVILAQPEDITIASGENAIFVVEVTGNGLTYQWQYSNNSGKYWFDSGMDGSDTNTLSVEALSKRNGQMYRCVITDANGSTVTSDAITLIITD